MLWASSFAERGARSPGLSPSLVTGTWLQRGLLNLGGKGGIFTALWWEGATSAAEVIGSGGTRRRGAVSWGDCGPPWGTERGAPGPCGGAGGVLGLQRLLAGGARSLQAQPGEDPPGHARGLYPGTGVAPSAGCSRLHQTTLPAMPRGRCLHIPASSPHLPIRRGGRRGLANGNARRPPPRPSNRLSGWAGLAERQPGGS